MADQTEMERFTAAMNTAIRGVAEQMRQRALTAPCGCAPTIREYGGGRCDTHCRVTVKSSVGWDGVRHWAAVCNGQHTRFDLHSVTSRVWGDLLGWATRHVNDHRAMLGGPDE